jgi:DNA polymerase phi
MGELTSCKDERDHHFGRVFGAEALIKSAVLFRSNSAVQSWTRVVKLILDLAAKKPWIREECGWIICSAIVKLPSKVADSIYAEEAIEQLNSHKLAQTPEGVAIWLVAKRGFPSMKFPRKAWHHEDPLNARDKQILAKVLKEASTTDHESASAEKLPEKGNWSPHLNFAWNVVLQEFYKTDDQSGWGHKNEKSKRINFVEFWDVIVDGGHTSQRLAL